MNQLQVPQNSHLCDPATAKLLPVEQLSLQGLLDFPLLVHFCFIQLQLSVVPRQPLARSRLPLPAVSLRLIELFPPLLLSGTTHLRQELQQPLGHSLTAQVALQPAATVQALLFQVTQALLRRLHQQQFSSPA